MPFPKSWVLRLPPGVREQPAWIFIGLMITLVGLGYMSGATSSTIQQAIGSGGLKGWGFFLAITGILVTYATWRAKPALEKMALRWLVFSLLAYTSWLLTQVDFKQASMTIILSFILIVLAEIRVGFLKLILSSGAIGVRDEKPN